MYPWNWKTYIHFFSIPYQLYMFSLHLSDNDDLTGDRQEKKASHHLNRKCRKYSQLLKWDTKSSSKFIKHVSYFLWFFFSEMPLVEWIKAINWFYDKICFPLSPAVSFSQLPSILNWNEDLSKQIRTVSYRYYRFLFCLFFFFLMGSLILLKHL